MVRTQIQLTEEQIHLLKKIAHEKNVSVASLIRQGVDCIIRSYSRNDRQRQVELAKEACGKYRSEKRDVSANHDSYLTEAYDS